MGKFEFLNKLNEINSVVCIAEFGSYRTEYWIKDRDNERLEKILKIDE